jgi:hypothetical protein
MVQQDIDYPRGSRSTRRPALLRQADIRRVLRATKREGAQAIEVKPDGTIMVRLGIEDADVNGIPFAPDAGIVL